MGGMKAPVHISLRIILVVAAAVVIFPACGRAADVPLKKVSCALLWKPQAQFAGYIVAVEKGFYRQRGLDVTLVPGGANDPSLEALKNKKTDFCIAWLVSAVQRRAAGVALVNVGQVVQRSALMLISRRSSGILKPQDMQGRKVSLWEGDLRIQPEAYFRRTGVTAEIVPQSYTVNLFLRGGVDAVSAMWYNEYDTIINSGLDPEELVTFFFSDLGMNFPEDGIYCLEETLDKDPAGAAAFVAASFDGWQYAFDHPDEAVDIVLARMREAHLPANRVHQRWMLSKMKDLIMPDDPAPAGTLVQNDFDRVAEELLRGGLIEAIPLYRDFYRPPEGHVQE